AWLPFTYAYSRRSCSLVRPPWQGSRTSKRLVGRVGAGGDRSLIECYRNTNGYALQHNFLIHNVPVPVSAIGTLLYLQIFVPPRMSRGRGLLFPRPSATRLPEIKPNVGCVPSSPSFLKVGWAWRKLRAQLIWSSKHYRLQAAPVLLSFKKQRPMRFAGHRESICVVQDSWENQEEPNGIQRSPFGVEESETEWGVLRDLTATLMGWLLRAYRKVISPSYGDVCKVFPTCSAYGLEAVYTHGAIKGSLMAGRRVLSCHPWQDGGIDPVPPGNRIWPD